MTQDLDYWVDGPSDVSLSEPPELNAKPDRVRLWVVRSEDVVHADEHCAFGAALDGGVIKHSNLTGGDDAYSGGELIFLHRDTIAVTAASGRYGPESSVEMNAVAKAFKDSGYGVWNYGYDDELKVPFRLAHPGLGVLMVTQAALAAVFGSDARGETPQQCARSSTRFFVRSQAQLAFFREGATGLQISAWDALALVGFERLVEVVEKGAVVINSTLDEPAQTLREQREALGVTRAEVALAIAFPERLIERAETRGAISPVRDLLKIAQTLGLNEDILSAEPKAEADGELAVRLRTLRSGRNANLSASLVLKLSEAAWVISKQQRIVTLLDGHSQSLERFVPDDDYSSPAWQIGYELANRTRDLLDHDPVAPIRSVREVIEQLGIPLVQAELGQTFAGATIQNGDRRGIVVNVDGDNQNVWVRRMTLCHELGHLLWDPSQRLKRLHVDRYLDLRRESTEAIESRANGFAIAFLVPRNAVIAVIQKSSSIPDKVAEIMATYGIAATAAKYHLANVARDWGNPLDTTRVRSTHLPEPDDEWKSRENWTVDFFPVAGVPTSRRGHFAGLVALAVRRGAMTIDQAGSALQVSAEELAPMLDTLIDVSAVGPA